MSNPLQHATINWDISRNDFNLLTAIAERVARDLKAYPDDRDTLLMDLNACHSNGCALDLKGLLEALQFDFAHDIYGIRQHINRRTGQLENHFQPRYAKGSRS